MLQILSIGVSVVSLLVAILAIVVQRPPRRRFSWTIRDVSLGRYANELKSVISADFGDGISVAQMAFWNSGTESLRNDQIPAGFPIRVATCSSSVRILAATLIHPSLAYNPNLLTVTVSPGGQSVLLNFSYLNRGQGAVIQIAHTGESARDLQLIGELINTDELEYRLQPPTFHMVAVPGLLLLSIVLAIRPDLLMTGPQSIRHLLISTSAVCGTSLLVGFLLTMKRQVPRSLLQAFEPEDEPVPFEESLRRSL